jgi:hypothetical protein
MEKQGAGRDALVGRDLDLVPGFAWPHLAAAK